MIVNVRFRFIANTGKWTVIININCATSSSHNQDASYLHNRNASYLLYGFYKWSQIHLWNPYTNSYASLGKLH